MLYLASQSPRRRELLTQLGLEFALLDAEVEERRQPAEPPQDYVLRVAREKAGAGLLQVAAVPGALVLAADTEVVLDAEVFGKPADAQEAERMLRRLAGRSHEVLSAVWVLRACEDIPHLLRPPLDAPGRVAGTPKIGARSGATHPDFVHPAPCRARSGASRLRGLRPTGAVSRRCGISSQALSAGSERSALSRSRVAFAALEEDRLRAYLASGEWRGKAGAYAIQGRAAAFVAHLEGSYSGVVGLPLFETAELLRGFGVSV